jgi:hypothetical protein
MNRHMTFVSKQCIWHQTIQVDEWHQCLFHMNLQQVDEWHQCLFHMNLQQVDFAYDYYCQIMAHEVCDVEVKALCIFTTPLCTFIAMCLSKNVNTYWTIEFIVNNMKKISLSSGTKGKNSIKVISVNCCSKVFNKSI